MTSKTEEMFKILIDFDNNANIRQSIQRFLARETREIMESIMYIFFLLF